MLASSSRVDNFLLSGQNVTCTHGFVLVIGTARTRHRKSIAFPANVTRSPPPLFLRREPGYEATTTVPSSSLSRV